MLTCVSAETLLFCYSAFENAKTLYGYGPHPYLANLKLRDQHISLVLFYYVAADRATTAFLFVFASAAAATADELSWRVGAIKSGRLIFMATRGDMHSFVYCHAKIAQQNHFHARSQTFLTERR
jgi:hypothetical protein